MAFVMALRAPVLLDATLNIKLLARRVNDDGEAGEVWYLCCEVDVRLRV